MSNFSSCEYRRGVGIPLPPFPYQEKKPSAFRVEPINLVNARGISKNLRIHSVGLRCHGKGHLAIFLENWSIARNKIKISKNQSVSLSQFKVIK